MLWFVTLHRRWRDRRRLMVVFFAGLVVISAVLVLNNPVYGFFSWTGYLWLHEVVQGTLSDRRVGRGRHGDGNVAARRPARGDGRELGELGGRSSG